VFEAADFQWWWRRDQHRDPSRQVFWAEEDLVAALVFTDWGGGRFQCDPVSADNDLTRIIDFVWPEAMKRIGSLGAEVVELTIRDDDTAMADVAIASGFLPTDDLYVTTTMSAQDRPGVAPLREGFELMSRVDHEGAPHHMIQRNGERVAELLTECSLYDPELDLAIFSPEGVLASYCLFWADPVTGVGLVEPMRTEDEFQGLGLGRHVLTAGLDLLAARGSSTLKVSHKAGNEPARRLYYGAGFRPEIGSRIYELAP
jgi:GNAT superfamily N-acetyltransferase